MTKTSPIRKNTTGKHIRKSVILNPAYSSHHSDETQGAEKVTVSQCNMGTSYWPRVKPATSTTTTTRAAICAWAVLVGVVVQLSHAHAETISTTATSAEAGGRFSSLEKEVVERLIKEWAPIVWLAPEEKFMPLGVEEFLRNVHAVDKGNNEATVKGMPLGDNSKKAYLVTNGDVDELLEDDNSFLYGKNPNQHHVPIYAVVRLCSVPKEPTTTTTKPPPPPPPTPPILRRVPYIPVSMNESGESANMIRRSSRLYPAFARTKRNTHPYYSQNLTAVNKPENSRPVQAPQSPTPDQESSHSTEKEVSEFIANLADNVKFTGDSGMNNNINDDYIEPQQKRQAIPSFHVTYWMFYPYSQGKTMCTLSLGPLGSIPFPAVYGYCLGNRKDIGSHVGDWEHMSLFFDGTTTHPNSMYVSAHDAGAYYSYNHLTGSFEFKKQETRKGILQRPNFPKTVTTFTNHPVLFAAKGSHGLWTAPGKHRFVKVARLYDVNGFGTPWHTWKAVDVSYENLRTARSFVPTWLYFKGKWGNPKSKCHPLRRIGLNFCEYTDGPTGIPLKEPHFQCDAQTNVL